MKEMSDESKAVQQRFIQSKEDAQELLNRALLRPNEVKDELEQVVDNIMTAGARAKDPEDFVDVVCRALAIFSEKLLSKQIIKMLEVMPVPVRKSIARLAFTAGYERRCYIEQITGGVFTPEPAPDFEEWWQAIFTKREESRNVQSGAAPGGEGRDSGPVASPATDA